MGMNRLAVGVLVCAFLGATAANCLAQPFGYGVNAADPTDDGTHDNLWRINLSSGEAERIGPLNVTGTVNSDVEALALESRTFLYGVDDATDSLLAIDTTTGQAVTLNGNTDNLGLGLQGNPLDPGMAFACDGRLLMSSVTRRTLYRLDKLAGQAHVIGGEGRLAVKIGDIAVRGQNIYGIGVDGDEGLYRIDPDSGMVELIGPLGIDIALAKAGLDFDTSGNLWAIGHIVDDAGQPQPSRILRIDPVTGRATLGATTLTGVKSLAVARVQCEPFGDDPPPEEPSGQGPIATPVNAPTALTILIVLMLAAAWRLRSRLIR